MFRFICNSLLHSRYEYCTLKPYKQSSMMVSLSLIRFFSSDSADNPHSFTDSHLTKTCGLSPKSALSAFKNVQFESPDKHDLVLSCFEKFGFSKTDISKMIRKFPKTLHCDPERTISPKVEFFLSKGVSTPEIVRIFTVNPWILRQSLENHLVPTFNILIELLQSDVKVVELIKRNPYILYKNPEGLLPNVNTLRENGVPASNILQLIRNHCLCIGENPVKFRNIVKEVKEMGFNPLQSHFVVAIMGLTSVSKTKRDGRIEVYKRWGWSDKDVTTAFRKFPWCMTYSNDKIMAMMDFYVNRLGFESSVIVNCPLLLGYSLKKRIIPRGAVIEFLSSKGLVKLDSSIVNMFICSETYFLGKYVGCHEEAPHLIKLYNQNLNLSDMGKPGKDKE